ETGVRRGQRLGDRLRPGVPGAARVLGATGRGDPRDRARLHRRDRPGQAPVADPQQRARRAAGVHPRHCGPGRVSAPASAAAHGPTPPQDSPLRNGAFLSLLLYRACAGLSYQIVAVTVGWHIYTITRDPFALGLVGLAEVLPYFCIAPFAGYLVDHSRRRTLGAIACLGLLTTAALLAAIAHTDTGQHSTWPIYAAIALTGMVRSFLTPVYN